MKVRPTDRTAELDIALDGRSVRASYDNPVDVPDDIGKRLLTSPTWAEVGEGPRSIDDVLADVGDDPAKAAEALAEEQARGASARKTLISKLEAVIDQGAEGANEEA